MKGFRRTPERLPVILFSKMSHRKKIAEVVEDVVFSQVFIAGGTE